MIAYLDETGDHSMELIDEGYPIFGVALLICDSDVYIEQIVPAVYRLKFDYFGHEGVILHSRDIRRAQREFGFLTDPAKRQPFYARINRIMSECEYRLIGAFIRKQRHKERYGESAVHLYEPAITSALERLLPLLEDEDQSEIRIVAESRGRREDDELRLSFLQVVNEGTGYVSSDRFRRINLHLEFRKKDSNLIGTQMCDLAAYPTARYILNKDRPNPAYEIVKEKFYRGPGLVRGLKIFP